MLAYGFRCYWCDVVVDFPVAQGVRFPATMATRDHLVPITKGGSSKPDNIVLSCWKCNKARGNAISTGRGSSNGALSKQFYFILRQEKYGERDREYLEYFYNKHTCPANFMRYIEDVTIDKDVDIQ